MPVQIDVESVLSAYERRATSLLAGLLRELALADAQLVAMQNQVEPDDSDN